MGDARSILETSQVLVGQADERSNKPQKLPEFVIASEVSPLENMRQEVLENMQQMGILNIQLDSHGQRFLVMNDLDIFRKNHGKVSVNGRTEDLKLNRIVDKSAWRLFTDQNYGQRRADKTLYWLFRDERVITKDDYERITPARRNLALRAGKIPFRSLFYIPQTEAAAFDKTELAKARDSFYLFFSDVSREWQGNHPTLLGFDGNLKMFETVTAEMVYGRGSGQRDPLGNLMVTSDVNDQQSGQERLTGKWFVRNFGVNHLGDTGWSDSPLKVLQLPQAKRLVETGLLNKKDFAKTGLAILDKKGRWYLNRQRFEFGEEFAECSVYRITGDEYIVLKDNKPLLWFKATIPDEKKQTVRAFESHGIITHATKKSFIRQTIEAKDMPIVRYRGRLRREEIISMSKEIPKLISFRTDFEQQFGTTDLLDRLPLEDQVAIRRTFETISDKDQAWKFIEVFQDKGLRLFADGFLHGRFDERILKLANHRDFKVDIMFDKYAELHRDISIFQSSFIQKMRLTQADAILLPGFEIFASRIAESFYYRSQDFFVAASERDIGRAAEQMSLLSDSLRTVNQFIKGEIGQQLTVSENRLPGGGPVGSVTWSTTSEGRKLKMVIRPETIATGRHGDGQARIGFDYSVSEDEGVFLRIDNDNFGVSLDLGSRGSKLVTMLNEAGLSHHTQEPFDPAFKNPKTFARYMRAISGAFGYDFEAQAPVTPA